MPKGTNLWSGDYQSLRVVAHMASPIAMLPHDALPLDGILEFSAFKLGWPEVLQHFDAAGKRYLPRVAHSPANFVLPLKRHGHKVSPDWYWCASWATFPKGFETDRAHWNKRFDGGEPTLTEHLNFGGKRGNINLASGRYKSYHMPLALIITSEVHWFVLGAADGIAKLLNVITHAAHKRAYGWGEVRRWDIWPCREDWSCWRDGQPMRAMPDRLGDYQRAHHGLRSPYHHPSRRRLCITPPPRSAVVAA